MKKLRKISALILALALVCVLSISAFAINEPTEAQYYDHDDIRMWHTVIGYPRKAHAVISFTYLDGTDVANDFEFSYSGRIDYTYCNADQVHPNYYEDGYKTASDSATGPRKVISTNYISVGYVMIDASMRFTTQFSTAHSDVNHNRPDTITVVIY